MTVRLSALRAGRPWRPGRLLVLISVSRPQGHNAAGRIRSIERSSGLIQFCRTRKNFRSSESDLILYLFINVRRNYYSYLIPSFILGPLVCFPSDLIWKCGPYRQFVGLLVRVIIPVARPLPTQGNTNIEGTQAGIHAMTFHALDHAATEIGCDEINCSRQRDISQLRTLHKVLSNLLTSRLTPHVNGTLEDRQRRVRSNSFFF
jgi:hypothetical protein